MKFSWLHISLALSLMFAMPYILAIPLRAQWAVYVMTTALALESVAAYVRIVREDLQLPTKFVFLVFKSLGVILAFAGIYNSEGMYCDDLTCEGRIDALYFSIITITSTGYGEIVPATAFRMVAAMQTILGAFTLGSVVAISVSFLLREYMKQGK